MYSLGALLAGVTAWLLLKALRATNRTYVWWSAYGLSAAAFCYTHNYAIFSLLAQAAYVGVESFQSGHTESFRQLIGRVGGFLCAGALAVLLYGAWFPALVAQIRAVRQDYWIPSVTAEEIEHVFLQWCTGQDGLDVVGSRLWLIAVAGIAGWTIWRSGRTGWFFLSQAALPWLLSLGISLFTGRSIFIDRYLLFAHFHFLGFWGVVCLTLPKLHERIALVCVLATVCLSGLWAAAKHLPDSPPAIAAAVDYVKAHYHDDELIIVDWPSEVNRLRYYTKLAGVTWPQVRWKVNPLSPHNPRMHIASLCSEDLYLMTDGVDERLPRRLWLAYEGSAVLFPATSTMKLVWSRTFEGGNYTTYTLTLYERSE